MVDDRLERARVAAEEVPDPEIPSLTCGDLGMIRQIRFEEDGVLRVDVAPTYSGCPATEVIQRSVREAVREAGFRTVEVHMVRSPPWTTDWITSRGRARLLEAGIAPPQATSRKLPVVAELNLFAPPPDVPCPHCGSERTERVSTHGSTPCKAMYRCLACAEPFEHFKCH
ncbi:MAG: 1,2-phenylacetyl-CoA epoxidase subunit PaaD [Myxococcota bacterium]